jgi:hypothetical protein
VAELVGHHVDLLAGLVVEPDHPLPAVEREPESVIVQGQKRISPTGEQPWRTRRPGFGHETLLVSDGRHRLVRERHDLFGPHLVCFETQTGPPGAVGNEGACPKRTRVAGTQPGLGDHHDQVAVVRQQTLQVGLCLELRHHELGDEAWQRVEPGAGADLVGVDDGVEGDGGYPAIAAVLLEERAHEPLPHRLGPNGHRLGCHPGQVRLEERSIELVGVLERRPARRSEPREAPEGQSGSHHGVEGAVEEETLPGPRLGRRFQPWRFDAGEARPPPAPGGADSKLSCVPDVRAIAIIQVIERA